MSQHSGQNLVSVLVPGERSEVICISLQSPYLTGDYSDQHSQVQEDDIHTRQYFFEKVKAGRLPFPDNLEMFDCPCLLFNLKDFTPLEVFIPDKNPLYL